MPKWLLLLIVLSGLFTAQAQATAFYDCEKYQSNPEYSKDCEDTLERMVRAKEAYDKEINLGDNIPAGEPLPEEEDAEELPPILEPEQPQS